jgi:hypothetical protein
MLVQERWPLVARRRSTVVTQHTDRQARTEHAGQERPGPGQRFPDIELPDHYGSPRRLSELAGSDPLLLQFYRGFWCPKEQACVCVTGENKR